MNGPQRKLRLEPQLEFTFKLCKKQPKSVQSDIKCLNDDSQMKVCLIYGKINALSRPNLNYHPVVRVYFDRYTRRHVDDPWGEW